MAKIENCSSVEDIGHPGVRGVLQYLNISYGLEIETFRRATYYLNSPYKLDSGKTIDKSWQKKFTSSSHALC